MRRVQLVALMGMGVLVWGACGPLFTPKDPVPQETSFGEKFFTMACQRVAYTSSLKAHSLDTSRPIDVSGSRYGQACRRGPQYLPADTSARDPKLAVLFDYRTRFIDAADQIFPGNELSELQAYMVRILPLTDNDKMPAMIRKMADLVKEMENDQELADAFARLEGRDGYRPRSVCLGVARELLNYPKLHELLTNVVGMVAEGGEAEKEFSDLLAATSFELRTTRASDDVTNDDPVHPGNPDRTLNLAMDLLFSQDPAFGSGSSRWLVRRDWRGLATVTRNLQTGLLPKPFIDNDMDGQPDVDSLGRFVSTAPVPEPFVIDQSIFDVAAGRDVYGRALDSSGNKVYEYIDLDTTLLAALTRDMVTLIDPVKDTALKLLIGLEPLLGERRQTVKTTAIDAYPFNGFTTEKAPLLDILYGGLQLLRDPKIDDLLEAVELLITEHEGPTARLMAAALRAKDIAKKYPNRKMVATSTFFDDLLIHVRQILNTPGLMEDVLKALEEPKTGNLAPMLANYFKNTDIHRLNTSTMDAYDATFNQKVDRSKSDSGYNRSLQQRLGHIIADTNGMLFCNKEGATISIPVLNIPLAGPFGKCDLFEVKNGAVMYAEAIARLRDKQGNLTNTPAAYLGLKLHNLPSWLSAIIKGVGEDEILKLLSGGIDGMGSHISAQAMNRLMFADPLPDTLQPIQDPAVDVDGHQINQHHIGSLLAWEAKHPGFSCTNDDPCVFYDAFQPIVQAFYDHNQTKLLIDILTLFHRHYSSPQSTDYQYTDPNAPNFSYGSNIVSYEPAIVEILESGDFMESLNAIVPLINSLKLKNGRSVRDVLIGAMRYILDPTQSPGLAYRTGQTVSVTSDGARQVYGGVSPIYLLADAFESKRLAFEKAKQQGNSQTSDAWDSSTSTLVDYFLEVNGTGSGSRFSNRRLVATVPILFSFLKKRLAAHRLKGDTANWLSKELPDAVEQKLSSPVVAAAIDLVKKLEANEPARLSVYSLLSYVIDEAESNHSFNASLTGLADMMQMMLDDRDLVPVARFAGNALKPELGLIDSTIAFFHEAIALDKHEAVVKVLGNAARELSPGKSPLQTLLDMSTEMHRVNPGAGSDSPYQGEDFKRAFGEVHDFMSNEQMGLEKFYSMIKSRCGQGVTCPTVLEDSPAP
jgi:hypothetical protein